TATQIVVTAPAGSGAVDVTVVTPGGTSAVGTADRFTYLPIPTVTGLSVSGGPTTGGTVVTITGTDLGRATSVHFGGVPTAVLAATATQVIVAAPAGAVGPVDVTVTTPGGTSAATPAALSPYSKVNQPVLVGYPQFVVGSDVGGPAAITEYNPNGSVARAFDPFPGTTGGVRTAVGDFNGDGTPDVVAGTGP